MRMERSFDGHGMIVPCASNEYSSWAHVAIVQKGRPEMVVCGTDTEQMQGRIVQKERPKMVGCGTATE